jgi:CHAT domain-containing protein/tetratricopeptide (TPR) repeat protein
VCFVVGLANSGCRHTRSPSAGNEYAAVERLFVTGELGAAQGKAHAAAQSFQRSSPEWSARFRLEEAKILVYQGQCKEAIGLLSADLLRSDSGSRFAAERLIILSLAKARLGDHDGAAKDLAAAADICKMDPAAANSVVGGELLSTEGVVAVNKGNLDEAERLFQQSLAISRATSDKFLETGALINLSAISLRQEHYDDALERADQASSVAQSLGAQQVLEIALGNKGWAYYQIGDFERALTSFKAAAQSAARITSPLDEVVWLNNAGLSEYRLGRLDAAEALYQRSLKLAKSLQDNETAGDADVAIGSLLLRSSRPSAAYPYIEEAIRLEAEQHTDFNQIAPLLLKAQLLTLQGDRETAKAILLDLDQRTRRWHYLRWEAQRSLARLCEQMGDQRAAALWFQRAIATYHAQRSSLRSDDTKLPFFANGRDLYFDYADYLVSRHKENAALALIDQGRAETLAEGLGLATGSGDGGVPPPLDARTLARRLHATLLVYSLGPQHSYLWAANGKRTGFYQLDGKAEILPLVASHRQALLAARDLAGEKEAAGRALYDKLVLPAQDLIHTGDRVYIVADEGLHGLNFETLLTPGRDSHYWIEDVTITHAASLRLLAASRADGSARASATRRRNVLVVGNPVYSTQQFAALPNAADEVNGVAAHFQPAARTLLTGPHATPATYMARDPEKFDYIHFVAHAVASEMTPLDSAVVLSNPTNAPEGAKLYAREILSRPLHAELVTISACQGSGVRAYAGEGLVGLAWAFLRAGSKNVIGALWDVSDASTPELMEHLYGQLEEGQPPDAALRTAKLAMLHSRGVFRKPIYWGAFQLYAGGGNTPSANSMAAVARGGS